MGHFPKEITSSALLYRNGQVKKITKDFRSRVGWELDLRFPLPKLQHLRAFFTAADFRVWENKGRRE